MGYSPSRDGYWYMVGIVRYLSFKKNILFFYQIYSYQISLGNKRCGTEGKPGTVFYPIRPYFTIEGQIIIFSYIRRFYEG
jgi:hypothetical protein